MRAEMTSRPAQGGFFLIEAMVAILIFALGVLGLVAMGGTAVSSQSDAQYRTDASSLADAIASQVALGIDRTSATTKSTTLGNYVYNAAGVNCAFNGGWTVAPDPAVQDLITLAMAKLPGANPAYQQIVVDAPGSFNRVEITLCWKTPSDNVPRRHTVVTYVN